MTFRGYAKPQSQGTRTPAAIASGHTGEPAAGRCKCGQFHSELIGYHLYMGHFPQLCSITTRYSNLESTSL